MWAHAEYIKLLRSVRSIAAVNPSLTIMANALNGRLAPRGKA
jgi:hypothetical protein